MANATRTTDGLYNKMSRFHASGSENGFIVRRLSCAELDLHRNLCPLQGGQQPRADFPARVWGCSLLVASL